MRDNRLLADLDAIIDACCHAWNQGPAEAGGPIDRKPEHALQIG